MQILFSGFGGEMAQAKSRAVKGSRVEICASKYYPPLTARLGGAVDGREKAAHDNP